MKLFPSKVTTVMSWTETLFGFGYMIGKKSKIQKTSLDIDKKNICFNLGPAVGSALYQLGGFTLPFLVVGVWCSVSAIGLLFTLPNVNKNNNKEDTADNANKKKIGFKDLIKVLKNKLTLLSNLKMSFIFQYPAIFMPFIDNFICFCGNGMVEAMLEPHLKDAGATQTQVGLSFLISGALYMCTTPLAGYVIKSIIQF